MRIGLTSIFVDDQDQAEEFYTQVLGFQIKTNAAYGPNERWLSVVAPEDPDGVQLVLHRTDEPARAFPGCQPGARPAGAVAAHRRLRRGGRAAQGQGGGVRQGTWPDGLRRHGCGLCRHLRQPAQPPPGLRRAVVQLTRQPGDRATPAEVVPRSSAPTGGSSGSQDGGGTGCVARSTGAARPAGSCPTDITHVMNRPHMPGRPLVLPHEEKWGGTFADECTVPDRAQHHVGSARGQQFAERPFGSFSCGDPAVCGGGADLKPGGGGMLPGNREAVICGAGGADCFVVAHGAGGPRLEAGRDRAGRPIVCQQAMVGAGRVGAGGGGVSGADRRLPGARSPPPR